MKENHGGRLLDPRLEDDRPQLLERGHDQNPDWRFKLDNQRQIITVHHDQSSIILRLEWFTTPMQMVVVCNGA